MSGKKVSARNAGSTLRLKKCKPTTLPRGARAARRFRETAKCFVRIATAARATYKLQASVIPCANEDYSDFGLQFALLGMHRQSFSICLIAQMGEIDNTMIQRRCTSIRYMEKTPRCLLTSASFLYTIGNAHRVMHIMRCASKGKDTVYGAKE